MNVQPVVVAVAILLTGVMAGIFFTWSNAVMPGIGKLGDLEFLHAFDRREISAFLAEFLQDPGLRGLVPVGHEERHAARLLHDRLRHAQRNFQRRELVQAR